MQNKFGKMFVHLFEAMALRNFQALVSEKVQLVNLNMFQPKQLN